MNPSAGHNERFTVAELASQTKLTPAFWRKTIGDGLIDVERYGRAVRVTQSALDQYLIRQQDRHSNRTSDATNA